MLQIKPAVQPVHLAYSTDDHGALVDTQISTKPLGMHFSICKINKEKYKVRTNTTITTSGLYVVKFE